MHAARRAGRPFDLALIDARMPGMDGLELLRAMQADPGLRAVRVVLLSSVAQRAALANERPGLSACLTKPVRAERLLECLCAVLGEPVAALPRDATTVIDEETLSETRFARRPRVLLVEDNEVNQRVGARMLEKLACAVDVAADGAEALVALEGTEYALVFMDCQMPGIDGYEAVRRLRRRERARGGHVPVVALTANAMPGDEERCLAVGMDAYLAKPLRLGELERCLKRFLSPGTRAAREH